MTSYFWLKLPHRLLHDPRYRRMPERLRARLIDVALAAGDADKDSQLPPTDDLAYILRVDPEELETDLATLAEGGWVSQQDGHWVASAFLDWQKPTPPALRMRAYRKRQKEGNDGVTERNHSYARGEVDRDIEEIEKREDGCKSHTLPFAVSIAQDHLEVTLSKDACEEIVRVVGDKPEDLTFWGQVLKAWALCGYNPRNTKGQLEYFARREIPGTKARGSQEALRATDGHRYVSGEYAEYVQS